MINIKENENENEKIISDVNVTDDTDDTDDTDNNSDTEFLNEIPNEIINEKNSILRGGVDMIYKNEYRIDYILPEDEKLINIEKVIKQVNKYIDNYNSPQMTKYNQSFKQLLQKYSNKKYVIKTVKNKNDSIKIIVVKNDMIDDNKQPIIKEITKPLYLFYDEDYNLYKLKNKVSNTRTELQYKYELLTSKINITTDEKKQFEKDRQYFIELLEEYYIYILYHNKINNISTINKTNLLIQEIVGFYKENIEINNPTLNSNLYYIDNSNIEIVNKFNIEKLTQFNNLMLQLSGKDSDKIKKDKKLIDEIKNYLDKKELNIINENIKKTTLEQNADTIINYIILSLPIV
jgi:hypothetical protein